MAYLIIILLILHAVSIEPLAQLISETNTSTSLAPSSNTTVLAPTCSTDAENKKYLHIIGILIKDMCPGDKKYIDYLFQHWMCLVVCSLQLRIFSNQKWSSEAAFASTLKTAYNQEYPQASTEVFCCCLLAAFLCQMPIITSFLQFNTSIAHFPLQGFQ